MVTQDAARTNMEGIDHVLHEEVIRGGVRPTDEHIPVAPTNPSPGT